MIIIAATTIKGSGKPGFGCGASPATSGTLPASPKPAKFIPEPPPARFANCATTPLRLNRTNHQIAIAAGTPYRITNMTRIGIRMLGGVSGICGKTRKIIKMPKPQKNKESPDHTKTEIRAQFFSPNSPTPVKIPNTAHARNKTNIAIVKVRTLAGICVLAGVGINIVPSAANSNPTHDSALRAIATTPAAVTDGDLYKSEGRGIQLPVQHLCYYRYCRVTPAGTELKLYAKLSLDVRFLFA
jgi:hypothetical protein